MEDKLICRQRRAGYALLALFVLLAFSCAGQDPRPAPELTAAPHSLETYLPDLPELAPQSQAWRNEPPFTEKEIAGFVRDMQTIQTMNQKDTVAYLLRDRGWTVDRLNYVSVKTALMVTGISTHSLEALSQAGPYYFPPTPEEIHAVQKFFPILNNLLRARALADN